jgi:peptide deformylase
MISTMYAQSGVGLAAPQVGQNVSLFVMDAGSLRVCINPSIVNSSSDLVDSLEGCLSMPGINGTVKRHKNITVEYRSENWELIRVSLNGLESIVFQHEFDHLSGIVFIDRMKPLAKKLALSDYVKIKELAR